MVGSKSFFCVTLLLLLCINFSVYAKAPPINQEFRLLIDVSGSMKKNDPENFRGTALRLILNIIPEQTRSGVWLFSNEAKVLVPLKNVDKKWKDLAYQASYKIHSKGLLTNIEVALSTVINDANKSKQKNKCNIILLSDGVIDVGNDLMKDVESRNFILETLLPKLKSKNIIVNTIALSRESDAKLLEKLAKETGGMYQNIENADDLSKAFFKIFESSLKRDSTPIVKNTFTIDQSINEFSILVFKDKNASTEVSLESPDKKANTLTSKDYNIQWFSDVNYELITVYKPQAGKWKLLGSDDPDNRILVLSNIKVKASQLPEKIFAGEIIEQTLQILANEKLLSGPEFLPQLKVSVSNQANQKQTINLIKQQEKWTAKGIQKNKLWFRLPSGASYIDTMLTSLTFYRSLRQTINVLPQPFVVIEKKPLKNNESHVIHIDPKINLIQSDPLTIKATVANKPGTIIKKQNGRWTLTIAPFPKDEKQKIIFEVAGITIDNRKFKIITEPYTIKGNQTLEVVTKKIEENNNNAVTKGMVLMKAPVYQPKPKKVPEKNALKEINIIQWMFGGGLFVLLGIGWGGTAFVSKRLMSKKLDKIKDILS